VRRLVAVLTVPFLAAACGGSKSGSPSTPTAGSSAAPTVVSAVAKTIAAGSEHVVLAADATAAGQHVALSGQGDFDSAKRVGKMHASIALSGIKTTIDEVLSGTTAYAGSPLFSSFLPAGKSWLEIDLSSAGKALGIDTSVLGAQDPAKALAELKGIGDLREIGTATIGGVATTHYRGTIDASKLPAAAASALQKSGATLGPADVWVGSDGYVHRMKVTTKASSGTGDVGRTVLTTTLSKFGESVSVAVPPASQTVDASKLSIPGLTG
jgi:LppX_LprAFG lipoprotein